MNAQLSAALLPFLASAGYVMLNEMGDKTQLLAMAFATRFRFAKVMLGVLIATVLNHGLAVTVGTLLASIPGWQKWVQLFAAVLFVFFGLWALTSDKLDGEETKKSGRGEVMTVAVAFFFAEMGDKTQLATITLSAHYSYAPWLVLLGTTSGMLVADGIGILVGVCLHRTLPAQLMKLLASAVFVLFGLIGLWESTTEYFRFSAAQAGALVALVGLASLGIGAILYRRDRRRQREAARK